MKKLLKELGIQVQELADMMNLPHSTLMSWFERGTSVPVNYSGFLHAVHLYAMNAEKLSVPAPSLWNNDNRTKRKRICRKLKLKLEGAELKLDMLIA